MMGDSTSKLIMTRNLHYLGMAKQDVAKFGIWLVELQRQHDHLSYTHQD